MLRCDAVLSASQLVAQIKGDKHRARSMGKEALSQVQAEIKCAALRLVYFTVQSEAFVYHCV